MEVVTAVVDHMKKLNVIFQQIKPPVLFPEAATQMPSLAPSQSVDPASPNNNQQHQIAHNYGKLSPAFRQAQSPLPKAPVIYLKRCPSCACKSHYMQAPVRCTGQLNRVGDPVIPRQGSAQLPHPSQEARTS